MYALWPLTQGFTNKSIFINRLVSMPGTPPEATNTFRTHRTHAFHCYLCSDMGTTFWDVSYFKSITSCFRAPASTKTWIQTYRTDWDWPLQSIISWVSGERCWTLPVPALGPTVSSPVALTAGKLRESISLKTSRLVLPLPSCLKVWPHLL